MKYFLMLLISMTFVLGACSSSETPSDPNPPVDPVEPPPEPEPEGPLGYDDSYQKDYAKLNQFGLPMGQCENIGEAWSWQKSSAHKNMPNCSGQEVGQACSGTSHCKINNLEALSCKKQTTYECHGWVFEREDPEGGGQPSFKPLKDAKAYMFWFSGCIIGICEPQSEVVKSDENGYYKFISTTVKNQVRVQKDSHYSACNMGKPFKFSDAQVENKELKLTGGHLLRKLEANSCK